MKPLSRSHIIWTLISLLGIGLSLLLRKHLPAELAKIVSDEVVATCIAVASSYGLLRRTKDKLAYEKMSAALSDERVVAKAQLAAARHKAGKESK